jgi:hypothetical protein
MCAVLRYWCRDFVHIVFHRTTFFSSDFFHGVIVFCTASYLCSLEVLLISVSSAKYICNIMDAVILLRH